MDVVFDAADDDRLALHIREDATDVAMMFRAQFSVAQVGAAVFR
jgi:hypothetical protein